MGSRGLHAEFTGLGESEYQQKNRALVLSESVEKTIPELNKFLEALLRVSSVQMLPTPDEWLKEMNSVDPIQPARAMGAFQANLFLDFYEDLFRAGLTETTSPQNFADLTTYDAARLFLLSLDKAITKLPWGRIESFLLRGLEIATRDMSLGQLQGVQHYLFTSKLSLVRPTSHELLLQMAANSEAFRSWDDLKRGRTKQGFLTKCSKLLVQP